MGRLFVSDRELRLHRGGYVLSSSSAASPLSKLTSCPGTWSSEDRIPATVLCATQSERRGTRPPDQLSPRSRLETWPDLTKSAVFGRGIAYGNRRNPATLDRVRALSSVGRAPARQAGGHWFEPSSAHFRRAVRPTGESQEPLTDRLTPTADVGTLAPCSNWPGFLSAVGQC